ALSRSYLSVGRIDDGLKQAEAWQADSPGSAEAHKDYALALYYAQRFKEAQPEIVKSLKLDGLDAEANRIRALVGFAQGDIKNALPAMQFAVKQELKAEKKDP